MTPLSSAPGTNVPGDQETKTRGLLNFFRTFWPDAYPRPPTEIAENLEPRSHCPDGHSRSLEPDTSFCLTCTFPTLSQTHHPCLLPQQRRDDKPEIGHLTIWAPAPGSRRPYVQPGQGPGDHPSSTLQQQLEKVCPSPLLLPGMVTMVSHQLPRWENIGGLFSAWCPWDCARCPSWLALALRAAQSGQAPQAWVSPQSTDPVEPGAMGPHGPLWQSTSPLTMTACLPRTPRSLRCQQASLRPQDSSLATQPRFSQSVRFPLPWGGGSGVNPCPDCPRGGPSVLSLYHIPCLGSLARSPDLPSSRKQRRAFQSQPLVPSPPPIPTPRGACRFQASNGGTRPLVPGGRPSQCPSPTPSQAAQDRSAAPRVHSSRGRGARWGNYRKCREKPWSFPIWSRRRRRGRCRQVGVAEPASRARAPRLQEPLPGKRARPLPSQPGPRPRARPLRVAPPRPAPKGDPAACSGGGGVGGNGGLGGAVQGCQRCFLLGPSISPSPSVSTATFSRPGLPGPRSPAPWRVPGPWLLRG